MKNIAYALIIPVFLLTACDNLGRNTHRASNSLNDTYNNMRYRMAQYLYHTDVMEIPPVPFQPPATFCYQVLMDIICYDRPRPELHLTLVAVQGEHAFAYQDFLPMPAGQTQDRFYQALYPQRDNHMIYDEAYDSGNNNHVITPKPRAKALHSDIIIKDLDDSYKTKDAIVAHKPNTSSTAPKTLIKP